MPRALNVFGGGGTPWTTGTAEYSIPVPIMVKAEMLMLRFSEFQPYSSMTGVTITVTSPAGEATVNQLILRDVWDHNHLSSAGPVLIADRQTVASISATLACQECQRTTPNIRPLQSPHAGCWLPTVERCPASSFITPLRMSGHNTSSIYYTWHTAAR